ncbi:hypothetical protein [Taibaiella chishuiensis]|uniref:Uncharacterized protein n=1 Tax=Taibaiella chishuiensis TaxID=1434707 RepID=A0A2P8D1E6_9BACT|nr:hypothetical protein [Taibaiella chishuiensis]PSK91037.1 hypothetical protein B0I18_10647 [Taibaiella chishuiensis]
MSLQIIMSEDGERAEGVLIPVKDWKTLEPFVDKESELYSLMERLTKKPPFEMTDKELIDHLMPAAEQAKQKSREIGLPEIYKNEDCYGFDQFIREYPNGRKELVSLDITNRTFTILKTL